MRQVISLSIVLIAFDVTKVPHLKEASVKIQLTVIKIYISDYLIVKKKYNISHVRNDQNLHLRNISSTDFRILTRKNPPYQQQSIIGVVWLVTASAHNLHSFEDVFSSLANFIKLHITYSFYHFTIYIYIALIAPT
jgi:hypothetical protein